ncbi:MAG: hypothetical protein JXR03_03785 [Cyclobacteriaceae bacterium]
MTNTSIIGNWQNSYNSILSITQQDENGLFQGTYSSSTGSTGVYKVVGFAPPSSSVNYPVSLSIFWKSMTGGEPDPTWHWVSMMCGEMILGEDPRIEVLHSMIANGPYPAVDIYGPGLYSETLVFTPSDSSLGSTGTPPNGNMDISGRWSSQEDCFGYHTLNIKSSDVAAFGTFEGSGKSIEIAGLFDADAEALTLATTSFSGIYIDDNKNESGITLGGFISVDRTEMELTIFKSIGTSEAAKYASTQILKTLKFAKDA